MTEVPNSSLQLVRNYVAYCIGGEKVVGYKIETRIEELASRVIKYYISNLIRPYIFR